MKDLRTSLIDLLNQYETQKKNSLEINDFLNHDIAKLKRILFNDFGFLGN